VSENRLRKWRLKKDTLSGACGEVPAGTVFTQGKTEDYAFPLAGVKDAGAYRIDFIEAHPEWFEEIKPRRVLLIEVADWPSDRDMPRQVGLLMSDRASFERIRDAENLGGRFTARIEERE
jgi:hypothetical protein